MSKSERNNELLKKGLISKEAADLLQKRLRKKLKQEEDNQKEEITQIKKELKELKLWLDFY